MLVKLLLMLSMTAEATDLGKFTIVEYNQPTPFAGVLFDEYATAKILSDYDTALYACDIRTEYQLKIQKEEYEFKLENLRIEKDALTKEYNLFIMQKNTEIDALAEALKKTSPQYKWLYFAGGILFGTASSYAAYRALK
ncbi:MAG: hypothetical protein VW683_12940 [Betaproteobacteria bacterium]|jgi:hypothetical protein